MCARPAWSSMLSFQTTSQGGSFFHDEVTTAGWQIANIDCIVFAERPKLGPYKQAIRQRLAAVLDIEADQIGRKAKTAEGLGAVGRHEAIAAQCVALLKAF